ncbi:MAG: hypothetical protein DDT31_01314 [Syntrophomonadaceae bacterium]|nr:hypothetical protein [Bacillota bacterium]
MLFDLKIYTKLAVMAIRSKMQYRADFIAGLMGVFALNAINLAQLGVLTYRFKTLGNWSIWELIFLYSLYMICRSIYSTFFHHIEQLEEEIAQGTFDQCLIRPVSPLLQIVGRDFRYIGIADLLFGLVCLGLSISIMRPSWGSAHVLWLLLFLISGVVIETAVALLCSCASFRAVRISVLHDIVNRTKLLTQQYPISIFGDAFRVLVTGFIPVAFINYYPAAFLLEKAEYPFLLGILSPVVAASLALLSALAWRGGIARYASTGN